MTSKYPKASLWRMKKAELLSIAESENIVVDPKLTRAKIIAEIIKIEAVDLPPTVTTFGGPAIPVPADPVESQASLPELDDYEEDDLPPASVRIQRIRKLKE